MALRLVLRQLPLFPDDPAAAETLNVPSIGGLRRDWRDFAKLHELTDREREIAELLRFEKTDQQIGEFFHCSKRTINAHMSTLRTKLKADSRLGIAMLVVGGAQCSCHPGWSLAPAQVTAQEVALSSS